MISTPLVSCLHPKKIFNPVTKEYLVVPCGKCLHCLNKESSRLTRLAELESMGVNRYVYFVTCTYDNNNIPLAYLDRSDDGSYSMKCYRNSDTYERGETIVDNIPASYVSEFSDTVLSKVRKLPYHKSRKLFSFCDYKSVQKFINRLRLKIFRNYGLKSKFIISCEYGPNSYRFHFHFLLFVSKPLPYGSYKALIQSWRKGSMYISRAQKGCVSYVASYCNSTTAVQKVYALSKTQARVRHSALLGSDKFFDVFDEKVDSLTRAVYSQNGSDSDTNSQRVRFNSTLILERNGKESNFPLDKSFKHHIIRKFYKRNSFKSDSSLLYISRSYYRIKDYYLAYGVEFDSVTAMCKAVLDDFTDDSPFADILFYLDLYKGYGVPSWHVDEGSYRFAFDKLYRFMLASKRSFSRYDVKTTLLLEKVLDNNILRNFYEDMTIFVDDGLPWQLFYDATFDINEYYKTSLHSDLSDEASDIATKKLIRKTHNDKINLLISN